jgi:hypothetical protein
VTKPSSGEPRLVAVEKAGLEPRGESRESEKQQSHGC